VWYGKDRKQTKAHPIYVPRAEIAISVRDSGAGIEAADLARIFTPFYRGVLRAPTSARGMGLGLAIAQELALALGGRIEVASTVGRGSTFRLVLPAGAAADVVSAPEEPDEIAGAVVLLIEDDERLRAETATSFRQYGARVIEAGDGFEGLRRAREERPNVIVVDLGLPGLGGVDVLVHLRRDRHLADVPVVVVTAERDAQLEARCREAGCAGYLLKPFASKELRRIVAPLARGASPDVARASVTR